MEILQRPRILFVKMHVMVSAFKLHGFTTCATLNNLVQFW